jgi:hypothetical protein
VAVRQEGRKEEEDPSFVGKEEGAGGKEESQCNKMNAFSF